MTYMGRITPPEILPGPGNVTYRVTGSSYDEAADITTVHAEPIEATELAAFIEDNRDETFARIEDRLRVAELFGGQP